MTTGIQRPDHTHSEGECWVPVFVAWAEGATDVLDLDGREAPERLQQVMESTLLVKAYASQIAQIRAVLSEVAVYEGLTDISPVVVMVSDLARDHEEMERRLDRIAQVCLDATSNYHPAHDRHILTGYSHKGGGFNNPLGSLRSQGYVTKGFPAEATPEGVEALGDYEALPTSRALLQWWLPQLSGPERTILQALAELGGIAPKDRLAEAAGYSPGGGGFNNPIGHLRTLGILTKGWPIQINPEMT